MDKGQWSSTAMGNYLHDHREAKQDEQLKRIESREIHQTVMVSVFGDGRRYRP
jgi:hypothetical protein